jgi:hypothetical protein
MDADARNPLDHGAIAPQTILMRIMPKAGRGFARETSEHFRVGKSFSRNVKIGIHLGSSRK